jgi:hypothetical protein
MWSGMAVGLWQARGEGRRSSGPPGSLWGRTRDPDDSGAASARRNVVGAERDGPGEGGARAPSNR